MLLALLKTNNMPYHVNALFLKIWFGHKRTIHGKALSLKKMKLHLKKSFPFSKCNITSSPKCNITVPWVFWNWKCLKESVSRKEKCEFILGELFKFMENSHSTTEKFINSFKTDFSVLLTLKTLSISRCKESNESDCIKRGIIILAYKNTD